MIFLRFKNPVLLRIKCVFFFSLFSRSNRVFLPKIGVSSTRNGGVEKRLSYYRVFMTFLTARSQNRRENTMFSAGFFFVKFRAFYLSQRHFCRFFGILEAKKRSKTCKFTVRADIHVRFVLCFTVFCENQDEKNSRKRVIYGTCT